MWRLMCVTLVLLICVKDSLSQLKVCGHAHLNPRIVGGADASEGAWPWMVSLHHTTNQEHFCGGSLINSEWVLTAAHCVFGMDKTDLRVYLGKRTQQRNNPHEINRNVDNIITYSSNYKCGDDIALLHLSSAVTFDNYIQPVCLAAKNSKFPSGTKGWITGWGDIKDGMSLPSPKILQEVEVEVYENDVCKKLCCKTVTDNMICAGTPQGGRGPWKGDSGGPLMNKHCSQWVQFGVISWSDVCAQRDKPALYTRVSEYEQWITSQTGPNPPGFVVFNPQNACSSANQMG